MMLTEFTPPDDVATFRAQLDWVSSWLEGRDARRLEDVVDEERNALLVALDDQAFGAGTSNEVPPGEPALFAILKPLTVAGYYTSEIGATQELRQNPMGVYKGDIPYAEIGRSWS